MEIMSTMAAAAAAAEKLNATKASGVVVRVAPSDFERILERIEKPLVIAATGGFWTTKYQYLTSYKGFAFFTKSDTLLSLPEGTEMVQAGEIWIPE